MSCIHCSQNNKQGFTLIEVLVTICVAAILLGLAAANFSGTISSIRLTTSANDLIASLNLARSEAIKRGRDVVIRKSGDNWEDGWVIFVDLKKSGTDANTFNENTDTTPCQADEDCKIRVFSSLPPNFTLRGNNNLASFIRYTPSGISNYIVDGLTDNQNDYFILCDTSKNNGSTSPKANAAKAIIVSTIGRARLALDTNSPKDDIPNVASGNVVSCSPS